MQNVTEVSSERALRLLRSSKEGITEDEVVKRKATCSQGKLKEKKNGFFAKLLSQFKDLMILILLFSSCISIVVGFVQNSSGEIVDGLIILGIVLMNSIFGALQERKAEKSLKILEKMSEPEIYVVRNNEIKKIETKNIVIGDVILLEEGTIIPFDARLIESVNLQIDESTLTGESFAVSKNAEIICKADSPIAEQKNMVFAGTIVSRGRGMAVVCKCKEDSEFGKIAKTINETKKDLSPLQKSIKDVGKILTYVILFFAFITFLIEVIVRGNPMQALLTAIAISVAAIPESMPAVITIIMSIGISKLARQKAIVKRMHSIETLGACSVICSDKTGTITQNKMKVKSVFVNGGTILSPESKEWQMLFKCMCLCNNAKKNKDGFVGDPTETALLDYAKIHGYEIERFKDERYNEIEFTSERKMMSVACKSEGKKIMYTKGAVDKILSFCTNIVQNGVVRKITESDKQTILKANSSFAEKEQRVLAFAYKEIDGNICEDELTFIGLAGMIDPPKKGTKEAIEKCKKAGMKPVMITGDHKETAFAIAKEIGLTTNPKSIITGAEIDKMDKNEFENKIMSYSVFARVSPQNKVQIVEAFKNRGHIVGMTGDGVNDSASLKKADIGIGMGISGTDVTKEVADVVITDDNFSTIIIAVEEGRKVFKNIQKTIKFLFAANMGEILSLFIATLVFPNLVFLLPVQILFVNLITDTLPAIALGVEKAENNFMKEQPRKRSDGLFSNGAGKTILIMGALQTVITLLSYYIGLKCYSAEVGATMAFYTLNLLQLFFLLSVRCECGIFKSNIFKNKMMIISLIFGFGLLAIIAFTPLREVLRLSHLSWSAWLIVVFLSLAVIVVNEVLKKPSRKSIKKWENFSFFLFELWINMKI